MQFIKLQHHFKFRMQAATVHMVAAFRMTFKKVDRRLSLPLASCFVHRYFSYIGER